MEGLVLFGPPIARMHDAIRAGIEANKFRMMPRDISGFTVPVNTSLVRPNSRPGSIPVQSNPVEHNITPNRGIGVGVIGIIRKGHRDARCPSARRLAMLRVDTDALSEGAAGVWTAASETDESTRAFRMV
ncbi:hypothetical protein TNCV_527301 [Trichonephila clavipes]|nr:hypothetical protein TNCV_527301 [Trichonephila clavipes]